MSRSSAMTLRSTLSKSHFLLQCPKLPKCANKKAEPAYPMMEQLKSSTLASTPQSFSNSFCLTSFAQINISDSSLSALPSTEELKSSNRRSADSPREAVDSADSSSSVIDGQATCYRMLHQRQIFWYQSFHLGQSFLAAYLAHPQ